MRDIKFRAWGPNSKYMWSWEEMGWQMTLDQVFGPDTGDKIIMQSTGLHDKNGKEIYEGDIVRYISIHDDAYMLDKDSRITGTVVYCQERCQFLPQEIRENHKGGHYISTWEFTEDIEVIGNIHSNPELLEGLS